MTLPEFLRWDDGTDRRYELADGDIVDPEPPNARRSVICGNLGLAFRDRIASPAWVGISTGIVPERKDTFYLADLAVTCEPMNDLQYLEAPGIVVEVLTPLTEDHDFFRKLPDYLVLRSIEDILFVSTSGRLVRYWRRSEGQKMPQVVRDGVVRLQAFGIELSLHEIYEGTGL